MHLHTHFSPARILRALACATALALFAGCDLRVTDLTPKVLPENPSRIYTLSVRAKPRSTTVVRDSITARIVVDGQIHEMTRAVSGDGVFEYDFRLPAGRDELAYYYIIDYAIEHGGGITRRQDYSDITKTKVVGRYVLTLETNRGPVGARIAVLGRGFGQGDVIKFDDQAVQTVVESPNSLHFFVPAVETARNYRVTVEGEGGSSPVGTFRVDAGSLDVSPSSLNLTRSSVVPLTFTLPSPAPSGGLVLDVTTNVPNSVIMPEVMVPSGASSVTIEVRGGEPGVGSLFLQGYGTDGEIVIPVTVQ